MAKAKEKTRFEQNKEDFLKKLREMRKQVRELELQYEAAKEEAKAVKKMLEEAQGKLNYLIDLGPDQLQLFDQKR